MDDSDSPTMPPESAGCEFFVCSYLLTVFISCELQISERRSKDSSLGESSKCKGRSSIKKARGMSIKAVYVPFFFCGLASLFPFTLEIFTYQMEEIFIA